MNTQRKGLQKKSNVLSSDSPSAKKQVDMKRNPGQSNPFKQSPGKITYHFRPQDVTAPKMCNESQQSPATSSSDEHSTKGTPKKSDVLSSDSPSAKKQVDMKRNPGQSNPFKQSPGKITDHFRPQGEDVTAPKMCNESQQSPATVIGRPTPNTDFISTSKDNAQSKPCFKKDVAVESTCANAPAHAPGVPGVLPGQTTPRHAYVTPFMIGSSATCSYAPVNTSLIERPNYKKPFKLNSEVMVKNRKFDPNCHDVKRNQQWKGPYRVVSEEQMRYKLKKGDHELKAKFLYKDLMLVRDYRKKLKDKQNNLSGYVGPNKKVRKIITTKKGGFEEQGPTKKIKETLEHQEPFVKGDQVKWREMRDNKDKWRGPYCVVSEDRGRYTLKNQNGQEIKTVAYFKDLMMWKENYSEPHVDAKKVQEESKSQQQNVAQQPTIKAFKIGDFVMKKTLKKESVEKKWTGPYKIISHVNRWANKDTDRYYIEKAVKNKLHQQKLLVLPKSLRKARSTEELPESDAMISPDWGADTGQRILKRTAAGTGAGQPKRIRIDDNRSCPSVGTEGVDSRPNILEETKVVETRSGSSDTTLDCSIVPIVAEHTGPDDTSENVTGYDAEFSTSETTVNANVAPFTPEAIIGTTKPTCRKNNCRYCAKLNKSGFIKIRNSESGAGFATKDNVSCIDENIIYCIRCKICEKQYVGQTKQKLNCRFRDHFLKITKKILGDPVGEHYNSAGHHGLDDVDIFILDFVPETSANAGWETKWMHQLNTFAPNGLNYLKAAKQAGN